MSTRLASLWNTGAAFRGMLTCCSGHPSGTVVVLIAGVFFLNMASVILQVGSFRLRKGRRIFTGSRSPSFSFGGME